MNNHIDVKRLYLPVKVEYACPECGFISEWDLNDQYISDPYINEWEEHTVECDKCFHLFEILGKLSLDFKIKFKPQEKKS